MGKKLGILIALILAFTVAFQTSLIEAATVSPLTGVTATANGGDITSISYGGTTYNVGDGDLVLGESDVDPSSHATYPEENADNFNLGVMASLDGKNSIDTMFGSSKEIFFIFENGGNDNPATIEALDSAGDPISGTSFSIVSGSWYQTDYKTNLGSYYAFGAAYEPDSSTPAYGLRIAREGYDPISHSAPVPIPGAVWLLGSGVLGMLGIRRKFKT